MNDKVLVIGNGFDLSIGAKTSYHDYFESEQYKSTRDAVSEWINICKFNSYALMTIDMGKYNFTCWDLLFFMESDIDRRDSLTSVKRINWCDVESVIHDSLTNKSRRAFSWRQVYEVLHRVFNTSDLFFHSNIFADFFSGGIEAVNIIGIFLYCSNWKANTTNLSQFHEALLDELHRFEKNFGKYILHITNNTEFNNEAIKQARKLIDAEGSLIVDSFNYSDFTDGNTIIRHINGNCRNPIFGIDLKVDEEIDFPNAVIFTKTSRRIQQDAHKISAPNDISFEFINKAVVFGHSLNRMDYDYFNYLFQMLRFNTFEIEKMGSLEFVYKIYNPSKERDIQSNYANKIYKLLSYYEQYVSNTNQHILINMLRFSGKLKINELRN